MASSVATTWLGPQVSFRTSHSNAGPVHVYGDSSSTLEWDGTVLFNGIVAFEGLVSGLASLGIGSSTFSVSLPSVPGNDSVTTSATINELTADSIVLGLQPASIWSGAYYDIAVSGKPSAASTLEISAVNSAVTAVDPDAMNFTVVWLNT